MNLQIVVHGTGRGGVPAASHRKCPQKSGLEEVMDNSDYLTSGAVPQISDHCTKYALQTSGDVASVLHPSHVGGVGAPSDIVKPLCAAPLPINGLQDEVTNGRIYVEFGTLSVNLTLRQEGSRPVTLRGYVTATKST